jgi:serine/threonine protein kinase
LVSFKVGESFTPDPELLFITGVITFWGPQGPETRVETGNPKQTGRNRSIDFRSDLYSFGVTLYEMLLAVIPLLPFEPMDLGALLYREAGRRSPYFANQRARSRDCRPILPLVWTIQLTI